MITSAVRQPFQLQPSTRETSETALTSTESKRQRTPLVVGGSVFMKHESFRHNLSNLDQMTVTKSVMIFFSPADNWLGITRGCQQHRGVRGAGAQPSVLRRMGDNLFDRLLMNLIQQQKLLSNLLKNLETEKPD